jgi:hypothetical protein
MIWHTVLRQSARSELQALLLATTMQHANLSPCSARRGQIIAVAGLNRARRVIRKPLCWQGILRNSRLDGKLQFLRGRTTRMLRHAGIGARAIGQIVKGRQLSLFVGSGVSCACGMPSWDKLITDMKVDLRRNCAKPDLPELNRFLRSSSPFKIAGLFKARRGEVSYAQFLRHRFRNCPTAIAPLLKGVVGLPVPTIFTTNYDKLLETACRSTRSEFDPTVIVDPSQIQALAGNERRIIKVHGDIDHPKSIILTDDDYLNYDDKYASLAHYLTGQLAFSTLLLVGFGLRDPNFDRIYTGARRMLGGGGTRVIALTVNQNTFECQSWTTKGLLINDFDSYGDLPTFLSTVRRHC